MNWQVLLHDDFADEIASLNDGLRVELLAHAKVLAEFGPNLGRPAVDTLNGSRHRNMKEMRFSWNGQRWRVAFAFDPERRAILLAGADKRSINQRLFYHRLISLADDRYDDHLRGQGEDDHGKET